MSAGYIPEHVYGRSPGKCYFMPAIIILGCVPEISRLWRTLLFYPWYFLLCHNWLFTPYIQYLLFVCQ